MNSSYKIVWNSALRVWQVASELVASNGKSKACKALALSLVATSGVLVGSAQAADLPTGGSVVAGAGSIAQNGSAMTINQGSDKLAINWDSFSIGQGNSVHFAQPGSNSVALNRVLGSDVSVIQGALTANGKVFLINPNGVLFTPSAQVDVGALVASTLNISTDDFMAGNYNFNGDSQSAIINQGNIVAANGGAVALIAARIINDGTITADHGSVLLGAGSDVTLDLGGPVKLEVKQGVLDALIENGGVIRANAGTVLLTAKAAEALASTVINSTGIIEARSLAVGEDGVVSLLGEGGGVQVAGQIDVSSDQAKGGQVIATGRHVTLTDSAHINADGATGGGQVLLGGSWQGKDASVKQAQSTYIAQGAKVDASATDSGNGGTIVAWSDVSDAQSLTRVDGSLTARGGANGGNGGKIETSGASLSINATVDASAAAGNAGDWLIDPTDVTVAAGNGALDSATVGHNAIETALAGTNVTIQADNRITWQDDFTTSAGSGRTLTLHASGANGGAGEILMQGDITATSNLGLIFKGDMKLGDNVALSTNGGNFNFVGYIDSAQAGLANAKRLTLTTTTGNVIFHDKVGGINALDSLYVTTSPTGLTRLNGAVVRTHNEQVYDTPVELGSAQFVNPNFDQGVTGWSVYLQRFITGQTAVDGVTSPLDNTYYGETGGQRDLTGADMNFTSGLVTGANGQALQLRSDGNCDSGYCVVRGPYVVSDTTVALAKGEKVSFDWSAAPGQDAYDVFGYLLNVQTGDMQLILNQSTPTAGSSPWTTSEVTADVAGTYKFVFVSGSYDATGGKALGASLSIDSIRTTVSDKSVEASALTFKQGVKTTDNTFTLKADEIDLGGSVNGTGKLNLQTRAPTTSIKIGGAGDVGGDNTGDNVLHLSDADLAALQNGYSSVTIGSADMTGNISVDGAATFKDDLIINSGSGNIQINAALTNTDATGSPAAVTVLQSNGGTVSQSSTGVITSDALVLQGAGATHNLNTAQNNVGTVASNTGAVNLTQNGNLTVGSVTAPDGSVVSGMTNSGPTNLAVSGNLHLANGITSTGTGAQGQVTLDVAGTTTQAATAPINAAGLLLLNPTGNYQLNTANNLIGVLAADAASVSIRQGGPLSIGELISDGRTVKGVTAQGNVQIQNNGTAHAVTLDEDILAGGAVTIDNRIEIAQNAAPAGPETRTINGASVTLGGGGNTHDNNLNLVADEVNIGANLSGQGALNIAQKSAATSIELGGSGTPEVAGVLQLTQAELNRIQNGFSGITIGSTDASMTGAINVVGDVELHDNTTLNTNAALTINAALALTDLTPQTLVINAAQGVQQGASGRVDADLLAVNSSGAAINLSSSNNSIGTLAAVGSTLTVGNTGDLTVGQVNGLTGIQTTDSVSLASSGAININQQISIAGGQPTDIITLNAGTSATQTADGKLTARGLELLGAGASYDLDQVQNDIGIIASRAGQVAFSGSGPLVVGTVSSTVGIDNTGNVSLSTPQTLFIDEQLKSTGVVTLATGAGTTQDAQGVITAAGLALSGQGQHFGLGTAVNQVSGEIAADVGSLNLVNQGNLTVGTQGALQGIQSAGAVSLTSTTGQLAVNKAITLAGGETTDIITLNAAQGATQGADGALSAHGLVLRGGATADYALGNAASTVNVIASDAGDLRFSNSGNLSVGTLSGTEANGTAYQVVGINNQGDVGLYTPGQLSIDQQLRATGGVTLNTAGATQAATAPVVAQSLALLGAGANYVLQGEGNQVGQIASQAGDLQIRVQGNTAVDSLSNIAADGTVLSNLVGVNNTGKVRIETVTGDIEVRQNLATSSSAQDAVIVNAGLALSAGAATEALNPATPLVISSGNVSVLNGAGVSTGAGGRAVIYTGSVADSTGLGASNVVGNGSGNFRYNSDEQDSNFNKALGDSGVYAVYREQPLVRLTTNGATTSTKVFDGSVLFNGGGIPGYDAIGLQNGDTKQMLGDPTFWTVSSAPGRHLIVIDVLRELGYAFQSDPNNASLLITPAVEYDTGRQHVDTQASQGAMGSQLHGALNPASQGQNPWSTPVAGGGAGQTFTPGGMPLVELGAGASGPSGSAAGTSQSGATGGSSTASGTANGGANGLADASGQSGSSSSRANGGQDANSSSNSSDAGNGDSGDVVASSERQEEQDGLVCADDDAEASCSPQQPETIYVIKGGIRLPDAQASL